MSSDQLLDWLAWMMIHPIEPNREDYRTGMIAALLAEAQGYKGAGDRITPGEMINSPLGWLKWREGEPERLAQAFKRATAKIGSLFGIG